MARKRNVNRNVALCYVRQSYTRDATDMNSPERQKASIEAEVERNGWVAEWYQDTDGHKSGRSEKNRPGWLALKTRLSDPDVIALVANDLSRLHRKGWRVGDLIDYLDEHDVHLVIAAPGRQIDLSSPQGRILVQFIAMLDEWYAADISRAKDGSAPTRWVRRLRPPLAQCEMNSYLKPSLGGAWLMPDATFAGTPDQAPDPGRSGAATLLCSPRTELYAEGGKATTSSPTRCKSKDGRSRPVKANPASSMLTMYGGLC
jgi:hypothetical protein